MTRLTFGYAETGVDALSAFRYGVMAEKCGFDALWLGDHFVDFDGDRLEPWTVLSAVAGCTKRIRLGSDVTDTQRNHPARTAQMVASLDFISKGRTILGIGAGEAMNIVPFGLAWETPRERVARLVEAIQVIHALWASSRDRTTDFPGRYYQLKDAFLSQPPRQKPCPPMYVGAFSSRRALEIAGRLGDGWISWFNTPETFMKRWSIVKDAARSAGRSPEKIATVSHLLVALPRSSKERKSAVLGGKAALLMEKSILATQAKTAHTQLGHYQNLLASKENAARIMRDADSVPEDLVHKTMAIGGVGEVEERTNELVRAGVKHIAFADLLSPRSAKRTLLTLGKAIKDCR